MSSDEWLLSPLLSQSQELNAATTRRRAIRDVELIPLGSVLFGARLRQQTQADLQSRKHHMVALNSVYQSQVNYQTGIQVEHALIRSNPDRFLQVAASAFYGIVELSGWVANLDDKLTAIQIAERIPGVTTVVESMSIDEGKARPCNAARLRPRQRHEQKSRVERNTARLRWLND